MVRLNRKKTTEIESEKPKSDEELNTKKTTEIESEKPKSDEELLRISTIQMFKDTGSDHLPIEAVYRKNYEYEVTPKLKKTIEIDVSTNIFSFNLLSSKFLSHFEGKPLSDFVTDTKRIETVFSTIFSLAENGNLIMLQEICPQFIKFYNKKKAEWESSNKGYYSFYLNYNEEVVGNNKSAYVGYFYNRNFYKVSDDNKDLKTGKNINYISFSGKNKQAYGLIWENKTTGTKFATVTAHIPQRGKEYDNYETEMKKLMKCMSIYARKKKIEFFYGGDFNTEDWNERTFGINGFKKVNYEQITHMSGGGKFVVYDHILLK